MSEEHRQHSRRGVILALLASGTVGGLIARAYAIAMMKSPGGVPRSLTTAGEVSFFLLGGLVALIFTLLVGVSPVGREMFEKRSGVSGLACGIGIGLLFGLLAVPLFCFTFLTLPKEITDFLMN